MLEEVAPSLRVHPYNVSLVLLYALGMLESIPTQKWVSPSPESRGDSEVVFMLEESGTVTASCPHDVSLSLCARGVGVNVGDAPPRNAGRHRRSRSGFGTSALSRASRQLGGDDVAQS